MSLSAGEQPALDSIESGLGGSDPGLVSLLATFARLASGEEMPVHEEIRVLRRRATRRPHGNRRPRRGNVRRDGRSLRLGWPQTIVFLWLAVTIAVVAVALILNRGSGNGPCPEAWRAVVCAQQAPAHSPAPSRAQHGGRPAAANRRDHLADADPAGPLMTDAATPNQLGRGQGLRRGALPDPGLCELFPADLTRRQARSARGQIHIRDGRPVDDSPAPSGRN